MIPVAFLLFSTIVSFLASDVFVRTNRRAIAMMFVRLSVYLSVWDGRES